MAPEDRVDGQSSGGAASALSGASEIGASSQSQGTLGGQYPIVECEGTIRVIGVLNDIEEGDCHDPALPDGWEAKRMFSDGSPQVQSLGAVPAGLQAFCMYEWVLPSDPDNDLFVDYNGLFQALDNYGWIDLDSVSPDCLGEYVQGDLSDPANVSALRDAFLDNLDVLDPQAAYSIDGPYPAVGVIDSVSAEVAANPLLTPASEHGLQMGALISDIMCPHGEPDCLDQVHYALALDRSERTGEIDWSTGGTLGSQGSLALAIYYFVKSRREAWEQDPSANPPRSVLNMSVGWRPEPSLYQTVLDPNRGPKRALEAVLEYASCQGTLMFAAAGNNPDEACPANHEGGLAPAIYEETGAPSWDVCEGLGFLPPDEVDYPVFPSKPSAYRPLVYAVGAVDGYDEPLINSRAEGMPRLVAQGAGGVAPDGQGGFTTPLSGSSVAAAAATAAAAQIIAHRPGLTPDAVAGLLYSSGWAVGRDSDFQLGPQPLPARRLSVCGAMSAADPSLFNCAASAPALDANLGPYAAAVNGVLLDPLTDLLDLVVGSSISNPVCEDLAWVELVTPQPEVPVCAHCNIIKGGGEVTDDAVNLTIDSAYEGDIEDIVLTTLDGGGEALDVSLTSAVAALNNGTAVVRVMVDTPDATRASLTFTINDPTTGSVTQTNPIDVL